MSTREQQKRLISRLRRSLITSSVVGSLGLAGYLGISTQAATASTTTDGTTTDGSTYDGTTSSYADQTGGTTDLSPGSGSSHATASGS